jgi:cytochrome c oxidase cbb3-type subunit III
MSSRYRNNMSNPARAAAIAAATLLAAPLSHAQPAPDVAPTDSGRQFVPTSTLFPGGGQPPPADPRGAEFEGNPQAIAEGARLFDWYNCSGCHFHGAGGMGPALIDPQWRYGGKIGQIHETLVQGRPNGMPSWGGKIPDEQLWQIAAYVKSLSQSSAANGTGQTMPQTPPPGPSPP